MPEKANTHACLIKPHDQHHILEGAPASTTRTLQHVKLEVGKRMAPAFPKYKLNCGQEVP